MKLFTELFETECSLPVIVLQRFISVSPEVMKHYNTKLCLYTMFQCVLIGSVSEICLKSDHTCTLCYVDKALDHILLLVSLVFSVCYCRSVVTWELSQILRLFWVSFDGLLIDVFWEHYRGNPG